MSITSKLLLAIAPRSSGGRRGSYQDKEPGGWTLTGSEELRERRAGELLERPDAQLRNYLNADSQRPIAILAACLLLRPRGKGGTPKRRARARSESDRQALRNRAYGNHLRALSRGRHFIAVRTAAATGEKASIQILPIDGGYTWRCPCGCRTADAFRTTAFAEDDFNQGHGKLLRAAEEQWRSSVDASNRFGNHPKALRAWQRLTHGGWRFSDHCVWCDAAITPDEKAELQALYTAYPRSRQVGKT